jgi:hypothetical protein
MCVRGFTDVSDLWVLRYIGDTLEQVDVLATIVDEVVSRPVTSSNVKDADAICVHPRATGADAPKQEDLSRDLEQLELQISTVG